MFSTSNLAQESFLQCLDLTLGLLIMSPAERSRTIPIFVTLYQTPQYLADSIKHSQQQQQRLFNQQNLGRQEQYRAQHAKSERRPLRNNISHH